MLQLQVSETQRIDGVAYVIGTPEWRAAKQVRDARLDSAFMRTDTAKELYERHYRLLERKKGDISELERMDANETAFLARDLVFKRAVIERTVYDENRAAEFVPIEGGHPEGAQVYETRRWNQRGTAQFSTELETANTPRAEVTQEGDFNPYVNIKASYAYTIQDLARAAYAGVPLPLEKALAAAEMIGRGLDLLARSGTLVPDGAGGFKNPIGLTGLFNHPDVPIVTLSHGSWDTNTTIANFLADFAQLEQAIIANARDNQSKVPYRLLVPTTVEGQLQTLQMPNVNMNVKNYLIANSRLIKSIERWIKLDDAAGSPVSRTTKKLGVAYPMDLRTLFWPSAVAYSELAPQLNGFEYMIYAFARFGGVEVRRPFEVAYVEALTA